MTTLVIWGSALAAYALFWSWYVGFRRKVTPAEAEATAHALEAAGAYSEKQIATVREFLANDDGRDFVMINLLHLKEPLKESRQDLAAYQEVFMRKMRRNAGHPVMVATNASGNIENVACEHADDWHAAAAMRYRSRRDMMEIFLETIGSEHHQLKLDSMEKTFAFASPNWFIAGGPRVLVALVLALAAALVQLAVS
jgi:hypothetical protein